MAQVIEVNDIDALEAYRMAWKALLEDTPRVSFFHTFEWLTAYWRHFGDGQKLRVLVVEAAGKPIGIVPLCVRTEQRQFGAVKTLTYPLDGWGMWYSPIGGAHAATLSLAMRHIATTPRDWDQIDLPWVDQEGADRGRTVQAMEAAGMNCVATTNESTSIIDHNADWETYFSGLSSKARHETRRHIRRVEELGDVEYVHHRPKPLREGGGDPAWDVYNACEEVARHSWQANLTDGNTISHERYRPFLREAHEQAARLGMVDMNLLKVDGKPVAFNYNYHHNGGLFALRMGYHADHAKTGVGVALMMRTIEESCRQGDHRFELGVGDEAYKHRIRTTTEENWRVTHAPLTSWRSHAVRLGRWVKSRRAGKSKTVAAAAS